MRPYLQRFRTLWVCLGLASCTLLTYWPVTGYQFTGYDDPDYVTANPYVQAGLSAKSLAWVWHSEVARNWHPVTMLSHMLDCQLHGLNPGWHHFTNLLLHVANTLLLLLLLQRLTGALGRSALVAALFAWHPLHVESVAWVAERKDVLSTFFFLLTLVAYARYAGARGQNPKHQPPGSREAPSSKLRAQLAIGHWQGAMWYSLSLLLFALGLMSKPMLVTLPFVLLLLDYWPLGRWRLAAPAQASAARLAPGKGKARSRPASPVQCSMFVPLLLEKLPFLGLAAASSIVTFLVQQQGGAVRSMSMLPLAARVDNALVSYVRYLGKMVWPEHLAALYLWPPGWAPWQVVLATAFLVGVTGAVLWQARRRPYLPVGWFWYVGTLVPVIGLVQVGMQTMADRYTYIPLIGIFIILAWGAWELAQRWPGGQAVAALASLLVVGLCAVLTRAQLAYWKDGETLLKRMVSATRGNYMAHYNLGNLYDRQGHPAAAIREYQAALRIEPNYADAENNLGGVLLRQHRFGEAIAHYRAAVRINTDFLNCVNLANALADAGRLPEAETAYQQALQLNPRFAQAHVNFGMALQARGKAADAMTQFQAALELDAENEPAHYNLANILAEAGKLPEAIAHYQAAERLNPKRAESFNGLGICYAMQGKMAEAEAQFRESLRLNPQNPGAESNLGNALGAENRLAEAIPHYQHALELNPKDYQTHFNLALSLLRQGHSAEAKAHLEQALRLHPDYPQAQKALARIAAP